MTIQTSLHDDDIAEHLQYIYSRREIASGDNDAEANQFLFSERVPFEERARLISLAECVDYDDAEEEDD